VTNRDLHQINTKNGSSQAQAQEDSSLSFLKSIQIPPHLSAPNPPSEQPQKQINPFGKPPRNVQLAIEFDNCDQDPSSPSKQQYTNDQNLVSDNSPNTTIPTNPYDKNGAPGLATNFVDINCKCVSHIRSSRCDLPFQSFANCHNAVLRATMKRNVPPMFFQCEGHYARMMMCMQKSGLSSKNFVEKPNIDTVYVRGL